VFRVDQDGSTKAVALQSNTWYDQTGFTPAAYITDHGMPVSQNKFAFVQHSHRLSQIACTLTSVLFNVL